MSLADIAKSGPGPRPNAGCALGRWAATLNADELAWLDRMLTERAPDGQYVWAGARLARRITEDPDYDFILKDAVITAHRRGECGCAR